MSITPINRFAPTDVWYTVCPVPSAISIALAKGDIAARFEGSGATLNNVRTHPDRDVREAHYDQTQRNLFREGGNIPPLWSRSLGRDVRLLGVTWINHFSALVALPGSGIRTVADLKGKTLGLVNRPNDRIDFTRATQLRGYLTALKAGGVSRNDVRFLDLTYEKPLVAERPEGQALSSSAFGINGVWERQAFLLKALYEGTVDALYLTAQGIEIKALADAGVIYDAAQSLDPADRVSNLTPITLTVKGELLDFHPEIAAEYVAHNLRTARWASQHPGEAARYVARDTAIQEEAVELAYPGAVSALETSLDPHLLDLLDIQKQFLLEEGFIPNDFALSDFVAEGPLQRARQIVAEDNTALRASA